MRVFFILIITACISFSQVIKIQASLCDLDEMGFDSTQVFVGCVLPMFAMDRAGNEVQAEVVGVCDSVVNDTAYFHVTTMPEWATPLK